MKRLKKTNIAVLVSLALFLLAGCTQIDLHEQHTPVPDFKWQQDFAVKGNFHISDTSSAYRIYIILRHTDNYRYSNIWLNLGFRNPGDTMRYRKLELTLANDAGGWEGAGMNDIWEVRKLIYLHRFSKPGEYRYEIKQIMRDNPLAGIMSVGIRVQKN